MKVGERIKNTRASLNLTQLQLAEKIGVKHNTVSDWENGRTSPSPEQIILICETLKISADILLGTIYVNEQLSKPEQTHIKKYRDLDNHGREVIDSILEIEVSRSEEEKAKKGLAIMDNLEASKELAPHLTRTIPISFLPASAGGGTFLDSNDFELVEVGAEVPLSANFGVRISGGSMEPQYPDGHIAWVKRTAAIDDGQIGIFIVNDQGYIKKQGRGKLISLNPEYDDIELSEGDDVRTYGLVVSVTEDIY